MSSVRRTRGRQRRSYPVEMRRPDASDVMLVAGAAAVSGVLVVLSSEGVADWVFGTFVFTLAGYVVRATVLAWLRARTLRARADLLASTEPDEVARAAIREERQRLGEDIAAVLRDAISDIAQEVARLDEDDPRPSLRRIHERTQLATSELRRQLGLLRAPDPDQDPPLGPSPEPTAIPRRDLVLGCGLALLAAVETTAYLLTDGPRAWLPWSPVLSALAAACAVGRTVAPGAASALCAVLFTFGSLVGYPVTLGFWTFGTVGCLVWALAARARARSMDIAGGVLLVASVTWTRYADDPDNLLISVLLMSVAASGGLVVRMAGHRESRSRARAVAREAELADAARAAVSAERAGFARELHDVTSHAVGVIAIQAAAGQVSWPQDPEGVRRTVAVIAATARSTLAELDRLGLEESTRPRGLDDLYQVVARIRAAGTPVDLTMVGELPVACAPVVHRVVQEALTNAVRHAPGAAVTVTVSSTPEQVVVGVVDDGAGPGAAATRGYGLVGLAERVALARGTLASGPGHNGGFAVQAVLPTHPETVPS